MIEWVLAKTNLAPLAIPIAWVQLGANKLRFAAALAGITFASILLLLVLGVFDGYIKDMNNRPIEALAADLFMVSRNSQTFGTSAPFPRMRLYQALAVPEVAGVGSLRVATGLWQDHEGHVTLPITVFGVDPAEALFRLPSLGGKMDLLSVERTALFDQNSNPAYGRIEERLAEGGETLVSLNGKRLRIGGTFGLGQTLESTAHLVLSLSDFGGYFPEANTNELSLGTITLGSGSRPREVAAALGKALPMDVMILTREEMEQRESKHWRDLSQVGFVLNLMVVVSTITGAIIIYQILYADVTEHIKEYSTLKAIGHSNLFLTMIVLKQGVIVAILGFLPGSALASILFHVLRAWKDAPLTLTWTMLVTVFTLELAACLLAGFFATRRLRLADPADTF